MCFGWIDSTYKVIESGQPAAQRFVPRKPGSKWSELNKARCKRMIHLGSMTEAGAKLLPDLNGKNFPIDPKIKMALKRNPGAWEYFCSCPTLYQRVRVDTIQIKKRQPKLFKSRLDKLVEACYEQRMIGKWDDGGRLKDCYIKF